MLEVSKVSAAYSGVPVLHQISLRVTRGELVALVGSNGAGKTTTLKTIIGTVRPSSGMIKFEGIDITRKTTPEIVQLGLSYVPEGRLVFSSLTVEENLRLGAFLAKSKSEVKARMEYVFHLFPILKERLSQKAGTLSGGEQQMLAIGRGLMSRPTLLMLDEPSLGLMPKLVDEVFATIVKLKEEGQTILLVEQNVREALDIADRGYVIQTGRIVASGLSKELLKSDLIRKAFLGI